MDQEELFRRIAVALAIGLLIGLERGWQSRKDADHQRVAGLRTFALAGLLGGVAGLVSVASSPSVLAAALVSFAGAMAMFSFLEATSEKNFSATGLVAAILTFMLGAYATLGDETVAVAAAVAMAILLALRDPLHEWVRNLTWPEIRSALMLLAMTFLMLPVLPNRTIDPWDVLNPAEIWLLAILIASISFAGYIAIRIFGDRNGIAVAAAAGGLASSTAVTLSFARLAREHPASTRLLASGILLANVVMVARIIVIASVLKPDLIEALVGPALAAGTAMLIGSGVLWWTASQSASERSNLQIKSPFDLGTVLQLAGLIAVIMLLAKFMTDQASAAGLYLLAAASGVADVDALTLSMARLAGSQVTLGQAANAILLAAGVNTVAKATMAWTVGGGRLGVLVGGTSMVALAAMALTLATLS